MFKERKKYKDHFDVNFDVEKNNPNGKVFCENNITKNVLYAMQEYIKRNIWFISTADS